MATITWSEFVKPVKRPFAVQAGRRLGVLARWWMTRDALDLLGTEPATLSDLPDRPGGCWILIVNNTEATHKNGDGLSPGMLWPELLLPLQWVEGEGHARNLPACLHDLADDVLRVMRSEKEIEQRPHWRLVLADDPKGETVDLSGLGNRDLGAGSGWASLAVGLWCAATGSSPDRNIFATACWETAWEDGKAYELGVQNVGWQTLPRKVNLAKRMNAGKLFVPQSQVERAQVLWGSREGIGQLHQGNRDPLMAFGPYLAAARITPDENEPFSVQRKHYFHIVQFDRSQAKRFRQERLFPHIVRQCHDRFEPQRQGHDVCPDHVITIASTPDLVPLAVETLEAERCVIFYDREGDRADARYKEIAQTAKEWVGRYALPGRGKACKVELEPFDFDSRMLDQFRQAVERRFGDVAPERIVFDVTPANKLMNYAFALRVAKPDNWLMYLTHKIMEQHKVPKPGTEQVLLARVGEPFDLSLLRFDDDDGDGPQD